MKMLCAVFVFLCMAGAVRSQAAGETCGASDACTGDTLVCQTLPDNSKQCRIKITKACVDTEDKCVLTSPACDSTAACRCGAGATKNGDDTACTCDDNTKVLSADRTKCVSKTGGSCTTAADCIAMSDCTGTAGSKVCACKTGYTPSDNMETCLKKIDQNCAAESECVPNAKCDTKCMCKTNYVANYDMTKCSLATGQVCTADNLCGENANCPAGTPRICKCKNDYFNQNNGRCGKKVDAVCSADKDCVPNAQCTGSPKKCKCKTDYSADSDKFCAGASAATSSLILLLAAFVVSRWM